MATRLFYRRLGFLKFGLNVQFEQSNLTNKKTKMKKVTLFAAAFAAYSLNAGAQIIESAWLPAAGMSNNSFVCSNAGDFSPGTAGADLTWDFSGLTADGSTSSSFISAAQVNGASEFSSANLAVMHGDVAQFYSANQAALQSWGEYAVGGNAYQIYSDAKDLLRFPIGFGQSFTDDYASANRASENAGEYSRQGVINVEVDANGTLITPAGTFNNVLRVKSIDTYQNIGLPPTPGSNPNGTVTTYSFISSDFPGVFLMQYRIAEIGGGAAEVSASYADAMAASNGNRISADDISIYPNPATDHITVRIRGTIQFVQVLDVYGRVVEHRVASRNSRSVVIRCDELTAGTYFIKVIDVEGNRAVKRFRVNG
jgi:hypothetical protein